ncbi:MAG: hypothetical protein WBW84_18585 [Acidobacteriaceae bacterium]
MRSTRRFALFLLVATLPVSLHAQARDQKKDSDEPPVQGSTVGYIDDAVIGSQLRVRFDAAFGDSQPDLAEFFQAACGCDGGTAAGPKDGLATDLNFQQLYVRGEYAPERRLSFVFELPARFVQPINFLAGSTSNGGYGDQAGLSDVSAGFKVAAQESERDSVTFQLLATFPSGDAAKGLGTAHYTIAPSLLYYQKVTGRFSLESEIGDSHPVDSDIPGFAGDVVEYGVGPSYVAFRSYKVQVTPVLELVAWRIFGGKWTDYDELTGTPPYPSNELDTADRSNIVNLKAGFRTSIGRNRNDSFYVGYGHALTSANLWYEQIYRIEYRRTF